MDPPVTATISAATIPTTLSPASPKAPQQPQSKPLSCTSCRARKLKCDRQHPCRNCVRSGFAECVFPERKRSRRPRKSKNSELLQRLHRLESIVGKVGLEDFADDGSQSHQLGASASATQSYTAASDLLNDLARDAGREAASTPRNFYSSANEGASSSPGPVGKSQRQGGQQQTRPHDSTASRYLSGDFWASLCEEVGGLRQALEQSADSDAADEDDGSLEEGTTPESIVTTKSPSSTSPAAMLLGPCPAGTLSATHVPLLHPPPEHIRFLTATYFQNVDMLLKILHRPTVMAVLHAFADLLERNGIGTQQQPQQHLLSPERESLFFAIYYAAVTSLPTEKCAAYLGGQSRQELAQTYSRGIERALARADYLNSSSLETLQALTLYTSCLRSHDGSRASWALLSLPIRLAQALDLHRDGDGDDDDDSDDEHGDTNKRGQVRGRRRFTPFEAEQRRRLWWQLIVLDIRAAEDRGTRAIVARDSYDTRLPHNVDDADFGPATAEPLSRLEKKKNGAPSDVTFSLATAESSGIFLYFEHAQNNVDNRRAPPPPAPPPPASSSSSAAAAGGYRNNNSNSSMSEEETVLLARHLEARYVHGADPDHAASYLASVTVRLIILKLWLAMRYPLHRPRAAPSACSSAPQPPHHHHHPPHPSAAAAAVNTQTHTTPPPPPPPPHQQPAAAAPPPSSHESTLRTATTIMELSERGREGPFGENFKWWSDMYVQWHPLAVALAELCTLHQQQQQQQSQPQAAEAAQQQKQLTDKAWSVIDAVFPKWSEVIADAKRGTLWRPIRALHKKARQARDAAAAAASAASAVSAAGAEGRGQNRGTDPDTEGLRRQSRQQQEEEEMGHIKTEQQAFSSSFSSSGLGGLDLDMGMDMDTRMEMGQMNVDPTAGGTAGVGVGAGGYDSNVPPDLGNLSLDVPMNGMSQEWLAWPDISFDMPPLDGTGWGTGMDWSTWDQFVLDTYTDTQSKSGSSEPS